MIQQTIRLNIEPRESSLQQLNRQGAPPKTRGMVLTTGILVLGDLLQKVRFLCKKGRGLVTI
jgi:hypothetical protein